MKAPIRMGEDEEGVSVMKEQSEFSSQHRQHSSITLAQTDLLYKLAVFHKAVHSSTWSCAIYRLLSSTKSPTHENRIGSFVCIAELT